MAKNDKTYTAHIPYEPKDAIIKASIFRVDNGKEFWCSIGNGELKFTYDKQYRGMNGELRIDVQNYRYLVPKRYNLNENFIGETVVFKPLIDPIIVTPYSIERMNFVRNNQLVHWRGVTAFQLLQKFVNREDITEFCDFAHSILHVDILRTFLACKLLFDLNPDSYDHSLIKLFGEECNKYGLVNEFVPFVDMHAIYNDTNKEKLFLDSVRQFYGNCDLEELVNENTQNVNTVDVDAFNQPGDILSSHGSNSGDEGPVIPFWNYAGFHEGRNEEHVRKIKTAWEYATASNKPVVLDELMRPDQYGYDRDEAFQMGFMSGMFGPGCTVHSDKLRFAEIPSGDELDCLLVTLNGLNAVKVEANNWNYGRFGPSAPNVPMPVADDPSLRTFVMMNDSQNECYLCSIQDQDKTIRLVNDWKIAEDFGHQCYFLVR